MTYRRWMLVFPALTLTGIFIARSQQTQECAGTSCEAAARGLLSFSDAAPHGMRGNGRSCADCHVPSDHFQLSPATAEARYLYWQLRRQFDPSADDPLFRPVDANDLRTNGAQSHDYTNLRTFALIRITLPLPSNVKLVDAESGLPATETTIDVWRAVPTVQNVALTGPDGQNPTLRGPNNAGGYQRDARFASLQEQARAAFLSHMEFVEEPPPALLDDLAAFEKNVFSSARVSNLADGIRQGMAPLPNVDPPLTEFETQGKAVFARACAHCHGGPGMSTTPLPVVVRYHDTNTSCPRPVDTADPPRFAYAQCPPLLENNIRMYEFTNAAGQKIRRSSDDPGRALLTGFVGGPPPTDDWNKFDVPGLRGIRHTAPYFHNHSAGTLEDVVDHYIAFFNFVRAQQPPGVFPPVASTNGVAFDRQIRPGERAPLVAYLKRL